jgi:hypothetical protein
MECEQRARCSHCLHHRYQIFMREQQAGSFVLSSTPALLGKVEPATVSAHAQSCSFLRWLASQFRGITGPQFD